MTEATEQNTTQETIQDVTQTAESAVAETPTVEAVAQPTHYTIQRGDTLIGISLRNYGSNSKVSEICSLNVSLTRMISRSVRKSFSRKKLIFKKGKCVIL